MHSAMKILLCAALRGSRPKALSPEGGFRGQDPEHRFAWCTPTSNASNTSVLCNGSSPAPRHL
jgi:hypothetical protein